jgi:glycosyltransferase involved in cell wall biosynthesis
MRLLVLNQYGPPDAAATAQMMADLVERAVEEGFDVTVVASNRSYARPEHRYPLQEQWKGADIRRVSVTGFGRRGPVGRVVDYLTFLVGAIVAGLRAPKPDVVLGMSTPPILGALAVILAKWRGARSAYWAMDVYPDVAFELGALRPRSIGGLFLGAVSRWTLRSVGVAIALGETMAERLRQGGATHVAVVHNWADERSIASMPPEQSRFRRAQQWDGKFVVLYSGNLGLAHEFTTILAAATRLRDANIVFAFVGTGPRLDEIQQQARDRRLVNVEFLASVPREDLGDLLAAGDLHLVTLRPGIQGLLVPSKIYGILAAGRPVLYVGPPAGEVHDIVSRGCGASVACGDVDALEAALRAYETNPGLVFRTGAVARGLFDAEFTRRARTSDLLKALRG